VAKKEGKLGAGGGEIVKGVRTKKRSPKAKRAKKIKSGTVLKQ